MTNGRFLANVRLGCKGLPGTNAIALLTFLSVAKKTRMYSNFNQLEDAGSGEVELQGH
jgi:hypothetical protein